MVKNINEEQYRSSSPQLLTEFNGLLFFTADDGVRGRELWTSDGTEEGTCLFMKFHPDLASAPGSFRVIDDTLFFGARYLDEDDGKTKRGLWTTDGTEAGTERLLTLQPGY